MTITRGYIETFEEAIPLAFQEAQVKGMEPEMAHLFALMLDRKGSQQEVEKLVARAVKGQYGKETEWVTEDCWQVAVPSPRYEARGLPSLVIEARVYVVASVEVTPEWSRRSWHIAVVEPLGKLQTTVLPLCFLQALLEGDEDGYRVVGKDGSWTSLEIPRLKQQPLRLHDNFVSGLRQVFKLKPVADWLEDFGSYGRRLVPLIVGTLLGLMYRDTGAPLPIEQQPYSRETLVEIITGMGYGTARAQRMLEWAEPELRAGMTLEEATRIMLRHIAEEV